MNETILKVEATDLSDMLESIIEIASDVQDTDDSYFVNRYNRLAILQDILYECSKKINNAETSRDKVVVFGDLWNEYVKGIEDLSEILKELSKWP